jgi:signal transduction histidine kinase
VNINVTQSKESQEDAARWDSIGNTLGIGIGALLIPVVGAVIVWLRRRAFAPIFALAAAMERFGRGDRDVRAAERGPRELREMCVRFNEMASAIAAQRQAQMAFLGGVAHDLRNPLAALQTSVSLLGSDKGPPPEDRLRQTVARLGRQIARMERMLGDFLDVAKIEAGQLELRLETHDARALVDQVVELFEDAADEHPLEVRVPEHEVLVRCDSLRIEQVITNLISNAIKYSPAGSSVEVQLESRGEELAMSVTDHGKGISEQDVARIFEPFRRVGLSHETVPGVGLGLFVVRRIVEAHGGRIELESRLRHGSTFRFSLPTSRRLALPIERQQDNAPILPH